MLILIFKHKNYVDNRFTKLMPHEIAQWCCKMGILEVCWKTPISPFVSYERCSLVTAALKFIGCSAQVRHLSGLAMLSLNFRLAKICQITFCRRLRKTTLNARSLAYHLPYWRHY